MNFTAAPIVPARLVGASTGDNIANRPGIGMTGRIMQRQNLRLSRIVIDRPMFNYVRRGEKTLLGPGTELAMSPGEAVAIAANETFDVVNRVGPAGTFEADWIVWDSSLVDHFARKPRSRRHIYKAASVGTLPAEFLVSVEAAIAAIRNPDGLPDTVAAHRMTEVLTWLDELVGHFAPSVSTRITSRVRDMVTISLADDWTSRQVAEHLAMSDATLRRRISEEGTSFGELLADVRMSRGLQLLQSSDMPITHIALEVGYESASRFAIRFRRRFGFAPSEVRGQRRPLRITARHGNQPVLRVP